jgi:N-acetyl sugar amidotransferase
MKVCSLCLMPSTRPRITFKGDICNACQFKLHHDVDYKAREKEFFKLLDRIKQYGSSNDYDCIVPWSGGKDSSYIALRLKNEFGLRPLLLNFNALVPTDVGTHNRRALLEYGFDSLEVKPSVLVSKRLSKRFLVERGNPKLHWDAGINSSIFKMSISLGIPYIFYAEHGETHYGGRVLNESSEKLRDYEEVVENQVGDDPSNWTDGLVITAKELTPYTMPAYELLRQHRVEAHYFGYYLPWNVQENYRHVTTLIDFKEHPKGRTYGTCTSYDSLDDVMDDLYYYMQYVKFGFGRCIRDLSRQIQNKEIDRSSAILIAKEYDGEYPLDSIPVLLDFLGLSQSELTTIIDNHRSSLVWENKNGNWINKVHEMIF